MTSPCPHCDATPTAPTPVAGEPNQTEQWIRHEAGCPGPAGPPARTLASVTPAEWDAASQAISRRSRPRRGDATLAEFAGYGPKPAKPNQNGTSR